MAQPCPEWSLAQQRQSTLIFLVSLCAKGSYRNTQGSEKPHWLFRTHRFFYWCGSLRPNILCDSHCLPDCLRLIIQIDHNSLCGGMRGRGFQRPGMIGKGVAGSGEGEWVFTASACSVAFTPARHVVIAILNLIAFLARAWMLKRLINGIPGMQ